MTVKADVGLQYFVIGNAYHSVQEDIGQMISPWLQSMYHIIESECEDTQRPI